MTVTLERFGGSSAANSRAYWGTREDWLVALRQNRDSDDIDRSNWMCITEEFARLFENEQNEDWAIERESHWAVGWVEALLVRPGTPAADWAQQIADRLADYPVFDDEHHSMLEFDEEWCVRCDRGTREDHERPRVYFVCGKFRSESDAHEIQWMWNTRKERRNGGG